MTRTDSNRGRALPFLLLFLTASWPDGVAAQQLSNQPAREPEFLEAKVSEFEMSNQTLLDALWRLSRIPALFGFGFEKVLKRRLSDPDIPEPHLSLRLKGKSVRQILDALCQADPRYTWTLDGATVNVFPKDVANEPSYLLNRKLEKFELKNATDVQNGLLAIVRQLPPPVEQVAEAQMGGADPYPLEPWTVTMENLTVRQVVNRLAAHGDPCAAWIFGGSKDFRTFGFFIPYFCSTQPPPWIQKIIGSRPKTPQP